MAKTRLKLVNIWTKTKLESDQNWSESILNLGQKSTKIWAKTGINLDSDWTKTGLETRLKLDQKPD